MKKESNARTYAIWITIFGLIFAVILIFVIPKADYYQAFNNIDAVRQIYLTKDSSQRTIEDYTNLIYSLSGLTTENQDKITINNNLTQSMFLSNDFIKKALVFVDHNAEYNTNLANQNQIKATLLEQIENLQNYCNTTLTVYLNPITSKTTASNNQVALIYTNQLKAITTSFANFYNATSEIIENSATKGMEVNDLTIAVNTNFNDCVQRILIQETISKSTTDSLKFTAESMFVGGYYINYFNNSVTVNNVVATFNGIA